MPPWGPSRVLDPRSWTDYLHFLDQPKDIQDKVLSFYAEMDGKEAKIVHEFVKPFLESTEAVREFVNLTMVVKFNSVTIHPAAADGSGASLGQYGHGLFLVACRLTHSCRPNCTWFSSQDGCSKIVRLLEPVKAGDVLTISYLDPHVLEKPVYVRRNQLQTFKNFVCICKRCTSPRGDDSRRFRCHDKRCSGHHYVKQDDQEDLAVLLPCHVCGESAPASFEETMLEQEDDTRRKIDYVDYVADNGLRVDITVALKNLKPPHESHALALQIYRAQCEVFEQTNALERAIMVQRKWINCRFRLHGEDYLDEHTGFGYERLGDLLVQTRDWERAKNAFQKAVRALQISRGGSSEPYTKCAMNKLVGVQAKLLQSADSSHQQIRQGS